MAKIHLAGYFRPYKCGGEWKAKGIHEMSDDECLEKANSIRIILTELCNRMNELLKDDKELYAAINLLTISQEPSHAQT